MQHRSATILERFIALGSYLTLGTVGFFWFIINAIFIKKPMSHFLVFNLIQSFIISILFAIFSLFIDTFTGILSVIPFIGKLVKGLYIFLFQTPMFYTMSYFNGAFLIFLLYLSIFAILGQKPYIPFISDIAKRIFN